MTDNYFQLLLNIKLYFQESCKVHTYKIWGSHIRRNFDDNDLTLKKNHSIICPLLKLKKSAAEPLLSPKTAIFRRNFVIFRQHLQF